jgi:hypothetical protein
VVAAEAAAEGPAAVVVVMVNLCTVVSNVVTVLIFWHFLSDEGFRGIFCI